MNNKLWLISIFTGLLIALYIKPPWQQLVNFLTIDQQPEQVDVIIVLSGGTERELYAADLYRQGFAQSIIMSGCAPSAQLMKGRAAGAGVPRTSIIIEDSSESTYENAVFSKDIVLEQGFKSAIVVSSTYHMRRSKMVFKRVFKGAGVKLIFCAAKGTGLYRGEYPVNYDKQLVANEYIKEYIKLIYYWFSYW